MSFYRGVEVEYPPDLPERTCDTCESSWVNPEEIKIISESFERQRLEALAKQKNNENEEQAESETGHKSS